MKMKWNGKRYRKKGDGEVANIYSYSCLWYKTYTQAWSIIISYLSYQ